MQHQVQHEGLPRLSVANPSNLIGIPVQVPSIEEQLADINRCSKPQTREPYITWSESRITWRRVIRALQRIGVLVDLRGAHPKLKFQNKTTRYLNSHEGDSAKNKHELYRVLTELDITKDKFFAALK